MPIGRLALALIATLGVGAGCRRPGEAKKDKTASGPVDNRADGPGDDRSAERPPDPNKPPADAHKTPSGLVTKVLAAGKGGESPKPYDQVRVHFAEWGTQGKKRDTWREGEGPVTFRVTGVVRGWTEALQLMKVGETRRIWVPDALGYPGRPGPPRDPTVFDIELVEIIDGTPPIPAPADVATAPSDATVTHSGLVYRALERGKSADKPNAWDRVKLHYTGWTSDGAMFDTSRDRDEPALFDMSKVLPGWAEGLAVMSPGDRFRMWVPQALAYRGRPDQPQGTLTYDIELVAIERGPAPPPVPKDVARAPKSARRTPSGLAYRVLARGKGGDKPGPASHVRVHYSAWTSDGKLFDSSVVRGRPASFRVDRIIPGWREGLQHMAVGDKLRLWIPEALAYKDGNGGPPGTLVFDVELLEVER